jgi:hypothetical protein
MSKNLYDLIQDEKHIVSSDLACMEMCLQTMIKLGGITNKQRIEFLKSVQKGELFNTVLEKFNNLEVKNIRKEKIIKTIIAIVSLVVGYGISKFM